MFTRFFTRRLIARVEREVAALTVDVDRAYVEHDLQAIIDFRVLRVEALADLANMKSELAALAN
jgi:hypothetical protein